MSKAKILIVEDEALVAFSLKYQLFNMGYEVLAAVTSGEEAIRKTAELKPDLVLMDIRIEGEIDGIEAAKEIYFRFHIPFIYVTANADLRTEKRVIETNPFGYLIKPYSKEQLDIAILKALEKHNEELNWARKRKYSYS